MKLDILAQPQFNLSWEKQNTIICNTLCLFANDNAFNKCDQAHVVISFIQIMCFIEYFFFVTERNATFKPSHLDLWK